MPAVLACRADELEEGRPRVVVIGKRRVAVTQWQGEVFAVRDVCPHMTSSYERGLVRGLVKVTSDGDLALNENDPQLRCPWHGWEFSLRTGQCLVDPKLRVRAYEAFVEDGDVYVLVEERGVRARAAAATEAAR
jgi:nitrite reductase (NADH) small subunit